MWHRLTDWLTLPTSKLLFTNSYSTRNLLFNIEVNNRLSTDVISKARDIDNIIYISGKANN